MGKFDGGVAYERETVNDFIKMTVELLVGVGDGFFTGVLRDALAA